MQDQVIPADTSSFPKSHPGYRSITLNSSGDADTSALAGIPLVEEIALAISFGGLAHAVMMVTPVDLEDFVYGFALAEGVIEARPDILDLHWHCPEGDILTWQVDVTLTARRQQAYRQDRRQRLGATGCGLCGVDSLERALPELEKLPPADLPPLDALGAWRSRIDELRPVGSVTGALHGVWLLPKDLHSDTPAIVREDIGRHNALDKLVGHSLRESISLYQRTLIISSRCSLELVQKAVRAGLSTLISLASPSTLAVASAQRYGLTLIHLPRHGSPRVFSHAAHTITDMESGAHHE
ncbi:formate dehydrogenase accessory sulfurtransferase FdhD [Pokkaliibacter sp. CJK22405]|uniref:formate dehydrogenase accessory sulfurtransferase FdhD n=1 Tax=Pokkaliibacter sp. CJK22405 TaxID=3384615 RepID=UPI00398546B4